MRLLLNSSYFPILKNISKYFLKNSKYFRERELSSGIDRDHQLSPIFVNVYLIGNSRKSVRRSVVPVAPIWVYVDVWWAAAPKGRMTYALYVLSLKAESWALRPGFGPWGSDLSFKAKIKPQGLHLSLEAGIWASRLGFEPQGRDLSLEARIWASRLEFEPQGWNLSLKTRIWASKRVNERKKGGEISRVKA